MPADQYRAAIERVIGDEGGHQQMLYCPPGRGEDSMRRRRKEPKGFPRSKP